MSGKEIVNAIIEAVEAQPGDTIEIVTPQFTRTPDMPAPSCVPSTKEGFDQLKTLSKVALNELGFGNWDGKLMLYPGKWYHNIPSGYSIVDISYNEEKFIPGVTDNDIRFGYLSFGFVPNCNKDIVVLEDD